MDIEAELPDNFDELSGEEKVEELEALKDDLDGDTDAGSVKKRMVEELIRKYQTG